SFFFQAEDGIRDFHVTGVQTCALPILAAVRMYLDGIPNVQTGLVEGSTTLRDGSAQVNAGAALLHRKLVTGGADVDGPPLVDKQIGRASCRERVEISVVAG